MKVAVVTGGSRGIGFGVVKMLCSRGYHVLVSYASNTKAAAEAEEQLEGRATFFKAEHTDRRQTYNFVNFIRQQAEAIDCIVCNAGITIRHCFEETTDSDWDSIMEVAVNAHFILLRELFPLVRNDARIIFTGSTMGVYSHAAVLGYGVSKATVHSMVKNLVKVFEAKQVTVNAVVPGFVETDWQKDKPKHIRQNICQKTAIHRFATIDEIVSAYAFCLDNAFVNGSLIEVNGGYSYQ